MEYALDKKQEIIQEFSKKKDLLHQQLDDKTERIENLKQRLLESENRKVTIEVIIYSSSGWTFLRGPSINDVTHKGRKGDGSKISKNCDIFYGQLLSYDF